MANLTIGGFRWRKNKDGARSEPRERGVVISNQTGGIFYGDVVKRVSDGTFIAAAAGDTTLYGICVGVERYKNSSSVITAGNYLPASTTYTGAPVLSNPQASVIYIVPLRGNVFEVDVDTAASTLTAAQDFVGNNADFAAGAGGSTTTGRSTHVLDGSGPGTGTAQFQILEIVQDPLNDVTAVRWKALVQGNEVSDTSFTTTGV